MYEVTFYKRDYGVCPVKSFIHDMDQTSDNQTQLEQILLYVKKLAEFGMNINQRFTRQAVKKIENDLYELRPLKVRIFFTIVNINMFCSMRIEKSLKKRRNKKLQMHEKS